jgi:hypothetical protein
LAYFLLALGGIVVWIDPSRNVAPVPAPIRWVWASFIVVGGAVSVLGAIKDWWVCEFVALPLLIVGFGALVVVLAAGVGTGRYAFAAWLGSIVVQTARRWGGLWKFAGALRRAQQRNGEHRA